MVKLLASIAVLLALVCTAPSSSSADSTRERIFVKVFNCAGNQVAPTMKWSATRAGEYRPVATRHEVTASKVNSYSFTAPAHLFWLTVQAGKCYDEQPVVVVPKHNRHFYAFLAPLRMLSYSEGAWLEGVLPKGVGSVGLRFPGGRLISIAVLDDGCYYIPIPVLGTYELDVSPHLGMVLRIHLVIRSNKAGEVLRRDITTNELKEVFLSQ